MPGRSKKSSSAIEFAFRSLGRKAQHSAELRKKMRDREYPSDEIEEVLQRLENDGYINDKEWVDTFIRRESRKGNGQSVILQKLRLKGVTPDSFDAYEDHLDALFRKKSAGKDLSDPKEKQKVIAALMRRGHKYEDLLKMF